jgi:dolichyl-phosphate beta-glucosyltransferase
MLEASGVLRLFTDADGATPIIEFGQLEKAINAGADIAVASRALPDCSCVVKSTLHRKIIGTVFNLIVRALVVRGIHDTQCGFKLFTEASAKEIFPLQQVKGFGFDVEILFLAQKKGFAVREVPVNWSDIPKSKVDLVWDSCRMFTDVLNIRINALRGIYGYLD